MLSDLLTQSSPKYSMKLHSNQEVIHFRPFLVREEKALLLALDENDPKLIMKVIGDVISSCCEDIQDPMQLPIYDIENIFLNLRAKSVSSIINLSFEDTDTGEIISSEININDIKITNPPKKGEFKLNDDVIVHVRYPVLLDFINSTIDLESSEGYYDLIAKCIVRIQTPDESIDTSTYDISEIKDFLESMNKIQFNKILDYFKTMPKFTYDISFKNSAGTSKTITLEGMQDFFGLPSVTSI